MFQVGTCEHDISNINCVSVRTNQQAPVCQRHSQVQAGSEGLLQADQRSAANHRHRIQDLPAGGVKGNVHFNTNFKAKAAPGKPAVNG